MAKVLHSLLFLVSVIVGGSYTAVFVNNVTMPSDALSEIFFNEIRNNRDSLNISVTESRKYDQEKCLLGLGEIVSKFPDVRVLPFFDAWGNLPSGIMKGHLVDIGNFDQCIETSVTLSEASGLISGQFCFASIPLVSQNKLEVPSMKEGPVFEAREGLLDSLSIQIGICVPDSCSPDYLTAIFKSSLSNVLNGALSGVTISTCTDGKKPEYRAMDIIGITFFCLIAALMVLSSIYDFLMSYFKKSPIPILLAFSMITNGRKLFAINTKKSPNTIDCLVGIRVFSMVWVMYAHTYGMTPLVPLINTIDAYYWMKKAWSMHVINATVSVDSFFFISGVLVAWLGFKEMDRTKGKLNVVMMYVHRYIRLTPAVAAGLLFLFSVNKFIGTGPFRQSLIDIDTCDGYNWWPVLLYIQNYFIQEAPCYPQTWYLAIDFQLYIFSPLVLIPMWKWGKKFAPVLVILSLLSIGCVMATFLTEGYTDLMGMANDGAWERTYIPMHTRYSPWLVGFGLGYFMHINRGKSVRVSKLVQLVGWIVSFTILVSVLFAPYFTINARGNGTVFETAMYESLKRVSWAIALAWITFACHFGFGGLVDSFLSHPIWQPLGRLTYTLYLVHLAVLAVNFGITRTDTYFSDYNSILTFWQTFGMSLLIAIGTSLAFESPVLVLEKFIFGKGKPEIKPSVDSESPKQNVVLNKDV